MQLEQAFHRALIRLRRGCRERCARVGTALYEHTVAVEAVATVSARGHTARDARRHALDLLVPVLTQLPDPCSRSRAWTEAFPAPRVCAFRPPPASWFDAPQLLGVDFEGTPPALVQIACADGVAIDAVDAPWASSVLADARHVHCVFGAHETARVANPLDLQAEVPCAVPKHRWSLADACSLLLTPGVRLLKDRGIHARVDWRDAARRGALSPDAEAYAAADALATRALGLVVTRATGPSCGCAGWSPPVERC